MISSSQQTPSQSKTTIAKTSPPRQEQGQHGQHQRHNRHKHVYNRNNKNNKKQHKKNDYNLTRMILKSI